MQPSIEIAKKVDELAFNFALGRELKNDNNIALKCFTDLCHSSLMTMSKQNVQTNKQKCLNKQTNKQKMSKQNHLSASYASFVTAKFRKLSRRGISVEIFI